MSILPVTKTQRELLGQVTPQTGFGGMGPMGNPNMAQAATPNKWSKIGQILSTIGNAYQNFMAAMPDQRGESARQYLAMQNQIERDRELMDLRKRSMEGPQSAIGQLAKDLGVAPNSPEFMKYYRSLHPIGGGSASEDNPVMNALKMKLLNEILGGDSGRSEDGGKGFGNQTQPNIPEGENVGTYIIDPDTGEVMLEGASKTKTGLASLLLGL